MPSEYRVLNASSSAEIELSVNKAAMDRWVFVAFQRDMSGYCTVIMGREKLDAK